MDRHAVREYLLRKYKNKIRKEILDKHIDGLVDEYFDTQKFILENGVDISTLPNRLEMKSWFQDPIPKDLIELAKTNQDGLFEINIDDVYIKINPDNTSKKDHLAEYIYKKLYNYKWIPGEDIPKELKDIIKLHKMAQSLKSAESKKILDVRLANYAFVGSIRFYHLEKTPYLKTDQVNAIINNFRLVLDVIYKIESGYYGDEYDIKGSLYIFDAFRKNSDIETVVTKEEKPIKKRKIKKDKSIDTPNGPE